MTVVLADTGPLLALFDPEDRDHDWSVATFRTFVRPLVTCDAVVMEATYQLGAGSSACVSLLEMFERGTVRSAFELTDHVKRVRALVQRYASVPMSFADACLVRMTELHADVVVWTLDSDFRVFRRHGRQAIPTLMPHD